MIIIQIMSADSLQAAAANTTTAAATKRAAADRAARSRAGAGAGVRRRAARPRLRRRCGGVAGPGACRRRGHLRRRAAGPPARRAGRLVPIGTVRLVPIGAVRGRRRRERRAVRHSTAHQGTHQAHTRPAAATTLTPETGSALCQLPSHVADGADAAHQPLVRLSSLFYCLFLLSLSLPSPLSLRSPNFLSSPPASPASRPHARTTAPLNCAPPPLRIALGTTGTVVTHPKPLNLKQQRAVLARVLAALAPAV